MHIFIDKFGGIIPRQPEHSLDITQAVKAHNVRLRRNRLEAWREPEFLKQVPAHTRMVYMHGCCPLYFPSIVSVANVAPDWGRLFITGNSAAPQEMEVSRNCIPTFSKLGVPTPVSTLNAACTQNCSRASDARMYVYTYVNKWGEESAPAFVSNIVTVDDKEPVRLTNFAFPPADYNITDINIYRAVTGFREQNVKQQEFNTTFLFIDTIPAIINEYTDTIPMAEVGPVLETEKVRMPPTALKNIVAVDNTVQLCGSVNNRLYFSELFQTYNWPVKYELTLDYEIVHIGAAYGQIFVTTTNFPYIVSPPSCEDNSCASIQRCATCLPDIGCSYAHSAITTPYGFIYSTHAGLALFKPDASFIILTAKWFSPEDWLKLNPHTVRLGLYQNYLFIVTDIASFILNLDRVPYGDSEGCELTTISDKPIDMLTTNTGELLMLINDKLVSWDRGATLRPFYWESRELVGQDGIKSSITLGAARQNDSRGVSWSPASAKVHTDGTKFTLVSPLQSPAYSRSVCDEDWFRLPRIGRNLWYKIILEGIHPVDFLALGTSNFTLNQGK